MIRRWILALVGLCCLLLPNAVYAQDLPGLYDRALRASQAGDFLQALPLWDQVLEQAPGDAAALSNRGNVRLALGSPVPLPTRRSMELAPDEPDPHLNRGTAEEALQDWTAAAADYLWILQRDPADASALYNLGNVRGSEGDWDQARELYNQAAEARPGFAMARSSAALAAWQQQDLTWAEAELRKVRRYPYSLMPGLRSVVFSGSGGRPGRPRVTGQQRQDSISAIASGIGCRRCAAGHRNRRSS